jgi:ParB family transcriptional regulator, chromosome partitioning protein
MQNSSAFQYLAIDTIHESATNPRRTFDETKLQEFAESIKHHGLIQPITVRPDSEGFEVIAGARRFRAAQLAELFSVLPASSEKQSQSHVAQTGYSFFSSDAL